MTSHDGQWYLPSAVVQVQATRISISKTLGVKATYLLSVLNPTVSESLAVMSFFIIGKLGSFYSSKIYGRKRDDKVEFVKNDNTASKSI